MKNKILDIEACDFESYPLGCTLSFAKQFVKNIENNLLLVGLAYEGEPIGSWFEKTIGDKRFKYFAFAHTKDVKTTKIPKRLYTYFKLKNVL